MKSPLESLNKVFESHARMALMALLLVNDRLDFKELKTELDLTDGNLASHMATLEKHGYIEIHKAIIGKKVNTTYAATAEGRRAFSEHLNALEKLFQKP